MAKKKQDPKKPGLNEAELKLGIWLYCLSHGWTVPPQPPGSNFLEKIGAAPRLRLTFGFSELVLSEKHLLTTEEKEARGIAPHQTSCWEVKDRASYEKVKEAPDGVTFEK